jgi:UDP-N-acetylglucosamine 2-epimerase
MGEAPKSILGTGCPSSDIVRELTPTLTGDVVNNTGSGCLVDIHQPFLLVVFHPTSTSYGGERRQVEQVLEALAGWKRQTIWPNIDAGSDRISKAIRIFRDRESPTWLRTITNLTPEHYLELLGRSSCAIGNSSSFVRDASFIGTPVVLVGDRQEGRETDVHVIRVAPETSEISAAVRKQLAHGRYPPSTLYGDGHVAGRIAEGLVRLQPYVQKRLHYIYEDESEIAGQEYAHTWGHHSAQRFEGHSPKERRAVAR